MVSTTETTDGGCSKSKTLSKTHASQYELADKNKTRQVSSSKSCKDKCHVCPGSYNKTAQRAKGSSRKKQGSGGSGQRAAESKGPAGSRPGNRKATGQGNRETIC